MSHKIPHGLHGDTILVDGGWAPISLLIKRRLATDWSHVGIIVDDLTVASARSHGEKYVKDGGEGVWIAEALPGGFTIRRSSVYAGNAWRVRTPVKPLDQDDAMMLRFWIKNRIGTAYDWPGVLFGHITRRAAWGENAKLFCSEAVALAYRSIEREVISGDLPASLIPPHFFATTPALKTTDWHIRRPEGWAG